MRRLFALPLALLMTGAAYAHNGMEHVMGTVAAISAHAVDVKATTGKLTTVITNDKTTWMKGKAVMKPADLHVGDRVVVHAKMVDGKLVAAEVETSADTQAH